MSNVYLFVNIKIHPGKMAAFLTRIAKHAALMLAEDGCISLDIYRDEQKENTICVWEVWRDRAAWDAHMVIDHSLAWQKEAPEYVESESITVMSAI